MLPGESVALRNGAGGPGTGADGAEVENEGAIGLFPGSGGGREEEMATAANAADLNDVGGGRGLLRGTGGAALLAAAAAMGDISVGDLEYDIGEVAGADGAAGGSGPRLGGSVGTGAARLDLRTGSPPPSSCAWGTASDPTGLVGEREGTARDCFLVGSGGGASKPMLCLRRGRGGGFSGVGGGGPAVTAAVEG